MDIIENFTSKFLDKIAKTKEDALLFGGLFVGFALGMAFFCFGDKFELLDIFKGLIVSALLFFGVLLISRGRTR